MSDFNTVSERITVRQLLPLVLAFAFLAVGASFTQAQDVSSTPKPGQSLTPNQEALDRKGFLVLWYSSAVNGQQLESAKKLIEEAREQKRQGRIQLTIIDVSDLNEAYGADTAGTLLKKHFGPMADFALVQMKQGTVYLGRYVPLTPEKWAVRVPEPHFFWESIQDYLNRTENPQSMGGLGWQLGVSEAPAETEVSSADLLPRRRAMIVLWIGVAILVVAIVALNLRPKGYYFDFPS